VSNDSITVFNVRRADADVARDQVLVNTDDINRANQSIDFADCRRNSPELSGYVGIAQPHRDAVRRAMVSHVAGSAG